MCKKLDKSGSKIDHLISTYAQILRNSYLDFAVDRNVHFPGPEARANASPD